MIGLIISGSRNPVHTYALPMNRQHQLKCLIPSRAGIMKVFAAIALMIAFASCPPSVARTSSAGHCNRSLNVLVDYRKDENPAWHRAIPQTEFSHGPEVLPLLQGIRARSSRGGNKVESHPSEGICREKPVGRINQYWSHKAGRNTNARPAWIRAEF